MAKRKRLDLPNETFSPDLETKSAGFPPRARMPIADVAGDTAGRAALEEVAREMTRAEGEGRVVKQLPLSRIEVSHLARDRMVLDPDEMEALVASIRERGQQTPIEVTRLSGGKFGLISGLRRYEALRQLGEGEVLALIRTPEGAEAAYQAMVEENEIRADLSFYERANIAVAATNQGVFATPKAAIKALFAHAPKAKRTKITKFVTLRNFLGASLSFPTAIPEHLGLALVKAYDADPGVAERLQEALKAASPATAEEERKALEGALRGPRTPSGAAREEIAPGLVLETRSGRAVFSGKAVDATFLKALRDWAAGQGGG